MIDEIRCTDFPVCPYCECEDQDWWDGLDPKNDGDTWSANCGSCGKDYEVTLSYNPSFDTRRNPND